MDIGLLGELATEIRLVEQGWSVQRLDTSRMAPNADLIAIKGYQRISLQTKTTGAKGHSHKDYLQFGYCTSYLESGGPFFNAKAGPIIADIVVGVAYSIAAPRFVVLPVALAELLCRRHADYWSRVPKSDGSVRSTSFPCYLNFSGTPSVHVDHHAACRRVLEKFEDNWKLLDVPTSELHNPVRWKAELATSVTASA